MHSKIYEDIAPYSHGFELTFRLADDEAMKAKEPPTWPLSLLQNLARYVFRTGNGFAPNQQIDAKLRDRKSVV